MMTSCLKAAASPGLDTLGSFLGVYVKETLFIVPLPTSLEELEQRTMEVLEKVV